MAPLTLSEITIRPAYADDDSALVRLATLDSAPVPAGPLLLAEVDGELRAALATDSGTVVADPFFRTVDLISLLHKHAAVSHAIPRRRTRSRAVPRSLERRSPRRCDIGWSERREPA